ncbi:hypothetical protein QFZ37_001965 [Chryseobacterium ginsenosidimutans]|nr:hypothetical protein [Chryseobacterium ginsenosidimutans]
MDDLLHLNIIFKLKAFIKYLKTKDYADIWIYNFVNYLFMQIIYLNFLTLSNERKGKKSYFRV